jgi:signal transduction histidine kinase
VSLSAQKKAYQRLACLYSISKLLAAFDSKEQTLSLIFTSVSAIIPLLSVVLIEHRQEEIKSTLWYALPLKEKHTESALSYARSCYGYLVGLTPSHYAVLEKAPVATYHFKSKDETSIKTNAKKGFILLPLAVGCDTILGALQFESRTSLTEEELSFINSLVNLIAVTLDRQRVIQEDLKSRQQEMEHRFNQLAHYQKKVVELIEVEHKLQAAVQARDDLMSICGHEFNNPLTTLLLQTQMAKRRLAKDSKAFCEPQQLQQLLQIFNTQIERMIRLVNDMLDITRINHGTLTLNLEDVNLSDLVCNIMERLSGELVEVGCVLTLSIEPDIIGKWDSFRIEQILINLLTNAMRYGKGKPISLSLYRQDNQAVICVNDQGIGIAKENHERIFQRFERAIDAAEVSGLGLGLFIVKEIVLAHKGTLSLTSELGQGATFMVKLPLT